MKALWNGKVIAESDATEEVEGNHYFPPNSIQHEYLSPSGTTTVCPWKGTAHYYTLKVDGEENPDEVWYYLDPKEAAIRIKDYIAFWRGVEVV